MRGTIRPPFPEQRRNMFVRDPLRKLSHILPVINERTPIEDIPSHWLRWIEPNIQRDWDRMANCWMWDAYRHQDSDEPNFFQVVEHKDERGRVTSKTRKQVVAKRFIAELFVNTHDVPSFEVHHLCGNKWCLNPSHLQVRLDHVSQNSDVIARDRRDLLNEWEYYHP